jgi:hypothetical protein
MLTTPCLEELRQAWLPNLTDAGLDRLIELLEKGSPLLIAGCFEKASPTGCLATHAAWHHPQTAHLTQDAGIAWLTQIARLNPATSHVVRAWDRDGPGGWELRHDLLEVFQAERDARHSVCSEANDRPEPTETRAPAET